MLAEDWERHAATWIAWARAPGHDSYEAFHRDRFFDLLPAPGRLSIDVGAGEGRVSRDLAALGHQVVALDRSPTLAHAAASHPDAGAAHLIGDAARLPLADGAADLAVAFMSLQDIDDFAGAISEIGRVLEPGGLLVLAIVHPINSAGAFTGAGPDGERPFQIGGSYLSRRRIVDEVERDGLAMTFASEHRPLEDYARALAAGGLVIEDLREVGDPDPNDKWHRVPVFLDLRARRLAPAPPR